MNVFFLSVGLWIVEPCYERRDSFTLLGCSFYQYPFPIVVTDFLIVANPADVTYSTCASPVNEKEDCTHSVQNKRVHHV